ncbi:protein gamma response 1 [Chrysoperla carnea]|uniref:protein gamma response 1 n=1 Tax=Chrysoperla carnea TaxID=189513 RepID=UPI001D086BD0|nr:protein gamma response 1 [Chrysoperla carnea]
MLMKILEQKVQELVTNQRKCTCKNPARKLDKSIQKGLNSPETILDFKEQHNKVIGDSPNEIINEQYQNTPKSSPKRSIYNERNLCEEIVVEETENIQEELNFSNKHSSNSGKRLSKERIIKENLSPNEIIDEENQNTPKRLSSPKRFIFNERNLAEDTEKIQEKLSFHHKHSSNNEKRLTDNIIIEETENIQQNLPNPFVKTETKFSDPFLVIEETENLEEQLNLPIHEKRLFSQIIDLDSGSDSSLDIINESCVTNSIETSPVLKNKNIKKISRLRKSLKLDRRFKSDDTGIKILKNDMNETKKKDSPHKSKKVIQSKLDTIYKTEKIKPKPLEAVQKIIQNKDNIQKNKQELESSKTVKNFEKFERIQNDFLDPDETQLDPFAPTFYCPNPTTPVKTTNEEKVKLSHANKPKLNDCYVNENADEIKKENLEEEKPRQNIRKFRDTSYDRIPEHDDEPKFAHRRYAVRKKADRAKLKGQTCYQCEAFFKAMGGDSEKRYQDNLNKCSRHRDNYAPSNTPPGFWKPTF